MQPYLHIGPITLASYGTMIIIGIACAALLAVRRSPKQGLPAQDGLFALIYGVLGLVAGAKLLYLVQSLPIIIRHWHYLSADLSRLASLLTSGFVFYGGLAGAIAGVLVYARQYRLPAASLLHVLIPTIPLAHGFGRIGCFMAGCCYGIAYDGPFRAIFPAAGFAPPGTPLFPVQLLEAALLFLLAAALLAYDALASRPRSLAGCYLLLYGVIRMLTETLRGDLVRGSFLFFSTSQWISTAAIICGIVLLAKAQQPPPAPEHTSYQRSDRRVTTDELLDGNDQPHTSTEPDNEPPDGEEPN